MMAARGRWTMVALVAAVAGGTLGGAVGAGALTSRRPCAKHGARSCSTQARAWRAGPAHPAGLPGRPGLSGPKPAVTGPQPTTTTGPQTTPTTPPAAPPTTTPAPQVYHRSGAALTEYALKLSRPTLGAGAVELNAINYGMDDHDLTVAKGGQILGQTPVVAPGSESALTLDLAPGTYKVYCSLYDGAHDAAGMHATLTVQ
ncbi:MAG: hypothetical protein JWO02_1064 [Solirubrobacterales bacterium]|nr:hypothetical protein [Solirubrobacterales bacterium]